MSSSFPKQAPIHNSGSDKTGPNYIPDAWENHELVGYYADKVGWKKNRIQMNNWTLEADPKTLLEIGCLDGCNLRKLRETGYTGDYLGVDITQAHLDEAKKLCPGEKFQQEDVRKLSLPSSSFDVVLFSDVLQHLPEPFAPMKEVCRVAKRVVLVSVYGSSGEIWTTHGAKFLNTWYTWKALKEAIPQGWKITRESEIQHPMSTLPEHKLFQFWVIPLEA